MHSGIQNSPPDIPGPLEVTPEDALRSNIYRLLSSYLSGVLRENEIAAASALEGGDGALGAAIGRLAFAARAADPEHLDDAYHELFIGLGRGLLVPYASYYLTGFLHEKPLARLRQDMAVLGIERDPAVSEPEDHIASVLEIMAGLIDGSLRGATPLSEQKRFFEGHVASWAPYFFRDLAATEVSAFYTALGETGRAFLEIEKQGFEYV